MNQTETNERSANDARYEATIQALSLEIRRRAQQLADYLVTQPRRQEAIHAARDFGWWCVGEGAKHAHDVSERMHRRQLDQQARHGDGTNQE